jgi:uncharacterized phage protein (TIGR01671 family)
MRTTKFRAWHNGEMYSVNTLGMNDEGIHSTMSFAHNTGNVEKIKEGTCVMFNELTKFMQFTGLTDKNGKEIYENDWCRAEFRDWNGITVVQGVILMDEYMWCLNFTDDIYSINRLHNFEVIGNIYENPELL